MTKYTLSQENNILKSYNLLLYFAGSMIMYEPSEECITDFWEKGNLKNLPVSSSNPNFIKAAALLRDSCKDPNICGRMLREDYIRLFGRQEFPLAPVHESSYKINQYLSNKKQSSSVTEFYNSYGWQSKFRDRINDDHLGIELLFLTLLVEKYLEMEDYVSRIEMRIEIKRFINQHVLAWIIEWNKNIQDNARTLCYKGIGTLIVACTQDLLSYFTENNDGPTERDYLKNLD